ncbi:MAG: hypothetical protein COU90_02605 [Candidatus Ryanbacteria bacterium CG10_big_fil_rev_8_21_14_0_10_43_42]|uniref:Glucosamine/galactosamine-6-phosphate isomerase domain-containing protein n=1 Tax=Candidatus Ryanbacteria bacterium CG10_big_fil_rev_8_21_14_0_10_43_42 TaxID=1974864 RepID=A0A2M8KWL5_9BACT|nr:MAG: hypothetical protein COU90_02605 [Candidatus Ryanbacteria bacterium CG10_big_fil_rev_8_21_14_0_10_43_42]
MDIFTFATKEEAEKKARLALRNEIVTRWGMQMLFLISGGSAFGILADLDRNCLGEFLTIGILDERADKQKEVNNFARFMKTDLYAESLVKGVEFIDTRLRDGESEKDLAGRIEFSLQNWRHRNKEGFVLITQGMGADGHTAGIMPYPEDPETFAKQFEDTHHWTCGYNTGEKSSHPLRATVTMPFLECEVDVSIAYIVGKEKQEAFTRLVAENGSYAETPARIMRKMKHVKIYTDLT